MLDQAIIMAGGEGRRLRPLTEERPKPLMPLLDEPVIGMTLRLLHRHGVRRVAVTLRYMASMIMDRLGDGSEYGLSLRYQTEIEPRGTAGSVFDAARDMHGTILVMSGDGLTDCDLTALYQEHAASGAMLSMVVKRLDGDVSAYGLCRAENGVLTGFEEKRPGAVGGLVNTGIYFLEREALALIPEAGMYDFAKDLIPSMLSLGMTVHVARTDAYWCDIGTRSAYHQAQMDLLMGRVGLPVTGTRMGHAIVAPGSRIGQGVRVTGRCYIGPGSSVGRGTVLGQGTILGRGASVGKNAMLENTTLWECAHIDGGTMLRNMVVIPDRQMPKQQRLVLCGDVIT